MMKAAVPVVGAVALLGAVQGTAQAATATADQPAPGCVSYVDHYDGFGGPAKVTVSNGCAATVTVKVVYISGAPSDCLTLAPQASTDVTDWSFTGGPNVAGLVTC